MRSSRTHTWTPDDDVRDRPAGRHAGRVPVADPYGPDAYEREPFAGDRLGHDPYDRRAFDPDGYGPGAYGHDGYGLDGRDPYDRAPRSYDEPYDPRLSATGSYDVLADHPHRDLGRPEIDEPYGFGTDGRGRRVEDPLAADSHGARYAHPDDLGADPYQYAVDRYAAASDRYGQVAQRYSGERAAAPTRRRRPVDPYGNDMFGGELRPDDPMTDPHGWEAVPDELPAAGVPRQRGAETDAAAETPRRRPRRPSRPDARERPARPRRRPEAAAAPPEVVGPPAADGLDTMMDVPGPRIRTVFVPVVIGTLVAVGLGVWAREHDPTGVAVNLAGFSSALAVKTWLATAAMALGLVQLWTALIFSGRIGRGATPLVGVLHRWSGRAAVLVSVPVAIQCLIALGWSGATPRALVHSLLGCVFYGAFATKMLLLRKRGVPGWAVAVAGGLVFAVLTGIWLTSAAWFFSTRGITF